MAKRSKWAQPSNVFSHWFNMIEGFGAAPSDFYKSVEAKMAEHRIPDIKTTEITCKEGGFFSAKRVYLRVVRKDKIFDICGAPFGASFFVSWWLGDKPPGLLDQIKVALAYIPIIGIPFRGAITTTYYQVDTMLMFQEAVHSAVTAAIDEMTKPQGMRPLSDLAKKPTLRL